MENQDSLDEEIVNDDYDLADDNDIVVSRKPLKSRVAEAWGNIRSIVIFSGTVVLWTIAAIFFLTQKSVLADNITPTTITLCNIMMGICIALAVLMAVALILSIVFFVKRNNANKNDKA